MSKRLFVLFFILMTIITGHHCKKASEEILLPDIRGTWDFTISWTENTCSTSQSDTGYASITQNHLDTETTTGTIEAYSGNDENLACPLWKFSFIMDSSGKMTVDEAGVPYDPQQCSDSESPDAKGDILMSLDATDSRITGTIEFQLSSASQGWNCIQKGTITYSNKH